MVTQLSVCICVRVVSSSAHWSINLVISMHAPLHSFIHSCTPSFIHSLGLLKAATTTTSSSYAANFYERTVAHTSLSRAGSGERRSSRCTLLEEGQERSPSENILPFAREIQNHEPPVYGVNAVRASAGVGLNTCGCRCCPVAGSNPDLRAVWTSRPNGSVPDLRAV